MPSILARIAVLLLATLPLLGQEARRALTWAPDGVHLVEASGKWLLPPDLAPTGPKEVPAEDKPTEPAAANPQARLTAALKEVAVTLTRASFEPRSRGTTLPRTPGYTPAAAVSADGRAGIAWAGEELWAWTEGSAPKKIHTGVKELRHLDLNPDGTAASYLIEHNLYWADLATGKETELSTDASEQMFVGELDWVYQEEVYGRSNFRGAWWSPSSTHLAYLRIDESLVAEFVLVDPTSQRGRVERLRYPKAGDGNPKATLHIASRKSGKNTAVDLSRYRAEDQILIVRVGFDPKGDRAIFMVQDREQTWLDLVAADPETGATQVLIQEKSRAWVNVLADPRWLADGSFLWESERTGYKHLYHYDADGKLRTAVTQGEWQVKDIVEVREKEQEILFKATADGAINDNTYRVSLNGEGLVRLTKGPGRNSVTWNGDRSFYLCASQSLTEAPRQWLCKADGTVVRDFGEIQGRRPRAETGGTKTELLTIPARDGYPLDAIVVLPGPATPDKKWPIFIETYSGPDAPTVANRPGADGGAGRYSEAGILWLAVNVRSASARGQCHTDRCYLQFGVQELKDLEDAVDFVVKERGGDPARVGITGFSYGGFMAAYALTHSKKFSLGIAGGGVYDWKLYDTIYTERYMKTPANNAEGYEKSSCVAAAKDLHGHLLMIHGGMDDNVHAQNLYQFADALQRANRSFEMMVYPRARHGIGTRHYQDLVWRTVKEKL